MVLFGTRIVYKKFALAISGVGLLLVLACGTGAAPTEPSATSVAPTEPSATSAAPTEPPAINEGNLPDSTLTEPAAPGVPPEAVPSESVDAESIPEPYTIGSNVGQRIPDFAIKLVDGSTVTSTELLAQRQPTFLFFVETW